MIKLRDTTGTIRTINPRYVIAVEEHLIGFTIKLHGFNPIEVSADTGKQLVQEIATINLLRISASGPDSTTSEALPRACSDARLCYVKDSWAYFGPPGTRGEDWHKRPWEHNSCAPLGDDIVRVAFDADMETPGSDTINSSYSVDDINAGAVAWLVSSRWAREKVVIPAGCTLEEFKELIARASGRVYLPENPA